MSSPIFKFAWIVAIGMLRRSKRLLAHLLAQRPRESDHEIVVQIGERQLIHAELKTARYEVRFEGTPAASGVTAVPWLLVREADGKVSYSGVYKPAPYCISRILSQVEHRILHTALPATGCATSLKLRVENIACHRIFKFIFAT